jgi:hypothetical protein
MNFTAISPFRPVSTIHKLSVQGKAPESSSRSAPFSHHQGEMFAASMRLAAANYAQYRPQQFTDTQVQQWIDRARRYRGWQYMSASMLVAAFLYEIETGQPLRTTRPAPEQVNLHADTIFAPYSDAPPETLPELRQRQKADLWRYLTYIYSLENPPVVMVASTAGRSLYGAGGWIEEEDYYDGDDDNGTGSYGYEDEE